MADEIKITISAKLSNGDFVDEFKPGVIEVTQTTLGADGGIVIVGTTEEVLTITDISTLGYMMIRNLDDTNFLTFGPESGGNMVAVGKLKPGETAIFRLMTGITFRWKADTANVKAQWKVWED